MPFKVPNKDIYDKDQLEQLRLGVEHGVDISFYDNPEYMALQMEWIRKGLEEKIDVSFYASPSYDWFQMEEIYRGIIGLLDVSKYLNPSIPYDRMREIRKGLEQGVDLSPFEKYGSKELKQLRHALRDNVHIVKYMVEGYEAEQLEVIRKAIADGIDIDRYLSKEYRGIALNEIVLGLKKNLNVDVYAKTSYSWQQMREIREGLEERLDINKYCSDMYNASQMHEIRLGLEEGLDVSYYRSLMYTAKEMHKRRMVLLEELTGNEEITMVPGKDGYHEYLFDPGKSGDICYTENGAIDYDRSFCYGLCKINDVIALYHGATEGKNGISSEGKIVRAVRGKEKRILSGSGVYYDEKYKAYIARTAGWIHLDEKKDLLEVIPSVTLDGINAAMGPVDMSGNLEICGNIEKGSKIKLKGDLIVDGYADGADIECSGNIIVRGGIRGSISTEVRVGKSLICRYIESCTVISGEDIRTGYIMSSQISASGSVCASGSRGSIIGSSVSSERGIICAQAGSEARVPTELIICYPKTDEKYEKMLSESKEKAVRELDILIKAREKFKIKYTAEERNTNKDFIKIESAIYTKNIELKEIENGYAELKELRKQTRKGNIRITERLYGGVVFTIDKQSVTSDVDTDGALVDMNSGKIVIRIGQQAR